MLRRQSSRLLPLALGLAAFLASALGASSEPQSSVARIPAGEYEPLYRAEGQGGKTAVEGFEIEILPVTNQQFLRFVRQNPGWRRSQVKPLFADGNYLRHWRSDLDFGPDSIADKPVTNVSWFAARAYARWAGMRLPTTAEWELVALASEELRDARSEKDYYSRILQWYSRPNQPMANWQPREFRNVYGVYGMHGLVWEWTEDFNTALVTGESRGDSGLERNLFCGSGSVGSSDFKDYAAFMRYAFRSSLEATYTVPNLGFRCARDTSR